LNSQTGIEDQPRVDFISTQPLPLEAEKRVIDNLVSAIEGFDVVLVADQAETAAGGVITPAVRDAIIALAGRHASKVFLVDSRKRAHLFRRVMVKPNRAEAEAACAQLFGHVDFRRLREHLRARAVLVTHGPQGALVVEEGKETWAQARAVAKPVDICGAGDSFAAGTALTMAVTGDPVTAASFGNLVASITVMKKGTGTASPREVMEAAHRVPGARCQATLGHRTAGDTRHLRPGAWRPTGTRHLRPENWYLTADNRNLTPDTRHLARETRTWPANRSAAC
jgi:bifunctional ADP-heptose synthase (sugar kinase/adenylyltransferase)